MINNILKLIAITLTLGVVISCEKDSDSSSEMTGDLEELKLGKATERIEIGQETSFNITDGGGDYHVFSTDEQVAKVELKGTQVLIKALGVGQTSIIVSDKNSSYKEFKFYSFRHEKIRLEEFESDLRKGHVDRMIEVSILQGNGRYKVESEDEELVTARISKDEKNLVLKLKGKGKTSLTLTDIAGTELKIPIEIGETSKPYLVQELNKIKSNGTQRVVHLEEDAKTQYWFKWVHFIGRIENGKNIYGLECYDPRYEKKLNMLIKFDGDTSVGEKKVGSFSRVLPWGVVEHKDQEASVEIIKNDGKKIWGTWSFMHSKRVFYGHFCLNIAQK